MPLCFLTYNKINDTGVTAVRCEAIHSYGNSQRTATFLLSSRLRKGVQKMSCGYDSTEPVLPNQF